MSEIIILSLKIALVAILFATPIAIFIAYILARWQFWGHGILNSLVYLPLVLPPVVTGFLLLEVFGPASASGRFLADTFGIEFGFRWTGAALAAGVMAFPLIVRPVKLAFETLDQDILDTAATLGAKPVMVFFTVSLPLALPGILSGAVLGFARALAEFGATITFVSNIPGETQTLSLGIYALIQSPDGDAQARQLVIIAIVISVIAVMLSEWLSKRLLSKREGE